MIKTQEELLDAIKNKHHITKEVTDTLIELDNLPSTGTQVYLNNLIVELYNRVVDINDDIIVDAFEDNVITPEQFIQWIEDNFTTYSANMFKKSIK